MTERELERQARHRLAVLRHVEEISGKVAATCRYYGISRSCYYQWRHRYEAEGLDGLKDHSPRATRGEVIEKIVWPRKHYHFGPAKNLVTDLESHTAGAEVRRGRLGEGAGPAKRKGWRHDRKRYLLEHARGDVQPPGGSGHHPRPPGLAVHR